MPGKVHSYINCCYLSLRPADWRHSFLPLFMGWNYLWLLFFNVDFSFDSVTMLLFFFLSICGFAALGYFINEFFDMPSDARAGKANRLIGFSSSARFIIFLCILIAAFLPWYFLPSDNRTWLLIAFELLLFLLYSMPFTRLKEVWFLAIFTDSLYAYVLFPLLSFVTVLLFSHGGFHFPVSLPLIACFFTGVRNILIHQVNDLDFDKKSGILTLPQKAGIHNTARIVHLCLVSETIFYLLFFWFLSAQIPFFHFVLFIFLVWQIIGFLSFSRKAKRMEAIFNNHTTNHFFQILFPILCVALLAITDIWWLTILPVHLFLLVPRDYFGHKVKATTEIFFKAIKRIRNISGYLVNYGLYYSFHVFGVDLIEAKTSAFQYMKKILTRK